MKSSKKGHGLSNIIGFCFPEFELKNPVTNPGCILHVVKTLATNEYICADIPLSDDVFPWVCAVHLHKQNYYRNFQFKVLYAYLKWPSV